MLLFLQKFWKIKNSSVSVLAREAHIAAYNDISNRMIKPMAEESNKPYQNLAIRTSEQPAI